MDRSQTLTEYYLEQELSSDEKEELRQTLLRDRAKLDEFVVDTFIHSYLLDTVSHRQLKSGILAEALASVHGASVTGTAKSEVTSSSRSQAASRSLYLLTALAASLLLTASFLIWNTIFASHPIGQLSQMTADCQWDNPVAGPEVGMLLSPGQKLNLAQGRVLITLVSGAQIVLEGPAALQVEEVGRASLGYGRLMASVPGQAIGFTIQTPLASFVDLGTQFTIDLQPEKQVDLYVFDGLVDMKPSNFEKGSKPLHISEGRAVRFDVQEGEVSILAYDEDQRISL